MSEPRWTLPELVEKAGEALGGIEMENGQVRAVPDERVVRYYAQLGLIDRPVASRGRTLLYGPRHLAQLVAIKRLQAVGRSLGEVQALLPTLDDVTLARVAGVTVPPRARERVEARFWRQVPATNGREATEARAAGAPAQMSALRLAPGVVVVWEGPRARDEAEVAALVRAAAPLVDELSRRSLHVDAGRRPEEAETEDDR